MLSYLKPTFLSHLRPTFSILYRNVIVIYYLASLFFSVEPYHKLFLSLVGITWAFHFYFTIQMVMTRQPDITQNGRLFSFIIIYNLNLITLGCWWICMGPSTFSNSFDYLLNETLQSYQWSYEHITSSSIKSKPICVFENGKNLFRKCQHFWCHIHNHIYTMRLNLF